MKMSGAFELPIHKETFGAVYISEIKEGKSALDASASASHAVNCHDELIAMLSHILNVYEMDYDDTNNALSLLEKARGEK